jgi:hypothetical protein
MFAVPDPSFVLKDTVGEMYFCNLRCFCVWSVQLATRPNLSAEDKNGAYSLTTPSGEEHQFAGLWMWRAGRRPMLLDEEVFGSRMASDAITPCLPNPSSKRWFAITCLPSPCV